MKWSNNGRTITCVIALRLQRCPLHAAQCQKYKTTAQLKVNFVVTKLINDYLLENKIADWLCDREATLNSYTLPCVCVYIGLSSIVGLAVDMCYGRCW